MSSKLLRREEGGGIVCERGEAGIYINGILIQAYMNMGRAATERRIKSMDGL